MNQTAESKSESSEIAALSELISDRRKELGIVDVAPKSLPVKAIPPAVSADELENRRIREEKVQEERKQIAQFAAWKSLVQNRGERYEKCRIDNFMTDNQEQESAIRQLTKYVLEIHDKISAGEGVVLFGPRGTGKDHLAMAVCYYAIRQGFRVRWQNGMDFFGDIRDAMDGDGDSERSMVERMIRPDVLYLSDPLPPIGSLTQFQASMMFRILDGRYSRGKPIICTVNVSGGVELDERMGPQNGDRLRDGALAIFCNWPSYRKAKT